MFGLSGNVLLSRSLVYQLLDKRAHVGDMPQFTNIETGLNSGKLVSEGGLEALKEPIDSC